MSSQFHKNMMALLAHWFPERHEHQNRQLLMEIYCLENYNYRKEPYPVPKKNIMQHLVSYKLIGDGDA